MAEIRHFSKLARLLQSMGHRRQSCLIVNEGE